MTQKIVILDFGSQTTQLIARRVRELGTYCEIIPYNKFNPGDHPEAIGIILSGSPLSVYADNAFLIDTKALRGQLPMLGICYGAQLMAYDAGGKVEPVGTREYGRAHLCEINATDPLFANINVGAQVWMSHGDTITSLPSDASIVASTDTVKCAAYRFGDEQTWGV